MKRKKYSTRMSSNSHTWHRLMKPVKAESLAQFDVIGVLKNRLLENRRSRTSQACPILALQYNALGVTWHASGITMSESSASTICKSGMQNSLAYRLNSLKLNQANPGRGYDSLITRSVSYLADKSGMHLFIYSDSGSGCIWSLIDV